VAANLLDNALKHTPSGGSVTLRAVPHFWERRVAAMAPVEERRRFRLPRPNSVEVSVTDSGPGSQRNIIKEIFEILCGWTGTPLNGVGTGHRQAAHPGASRKSLGGERVADGSRFTFLLPMDQAEAREFFVIEREKSWP